MPKIIQDFDNSKGTIAYTGQTTIRQTMIDTASDRILYSNELSENIIIDRVRVLVKTAFTGGTPKLHISLGDTAGSDPATAAAADKWVVDQSINAVGLTILTFTPIWLTKKRFLNFKVLDTNSTGNGELKLFYDVIDEKRKGTFNG